MAQSFIEDGHGSGQNQVAVGMKSRQHFFNKEIYFNEDLKIDYSSLGAAGAALVTPHDLLKFLIEIEKHNLLKNLNWSFYLGSVQQGDASIWVNEPTKDNMTLRWHNGSTSGFYSFVATIPETETHIVMLSNIHRKSSKDVTEFFEQVNNLVSNNSYLIPTE
jgi:hypothetical protein